MKAVRITSHWLSDEETPHAGWIYSVAEPEVSAFDRSS
jgi:hypothetical protein